MDASFEQARSESNNISCGWGSGISTTGATGVNPQRPSGYVVDENGRRKPHPTEAPIVRVKDDESLGGGNSHSQVWRAEPRTCQAERSFP